MNVAIAGGGPGGLYAAILLRRLGHAVTVFERNAASDTFGFGVVFSDETLTAFEAADPKSYRKIEASFARWADIDIYYRQSLQRSGGHGFAALGRKRLLNVLQERGIELGAEINFLTEASPADELAANYDLVIAADGQNSQIRQERSDVFRPSLERRQSKYMWLGTDLVFEAFTFHIVETDAGVFQIHGYPFNREMSTFIVETSEETWHRAGLDINEERAFLPGQNDDEGVEFCRRQFADILEGHQLFANNSKWLNFNTVHNERWSDGNVVLLGDSAHTAHFSIGSGTKMAMEDAISLAWAIREADGDLAEAIPNYVAERMPLVKSTQRAAQASLEWFEDIDRYIGQPPRQFAFNLLTRSRRITYDNLRLRDAEFVDSVDVEFFGQKEEMRPPMFLPIQLRELELPNRIVVSPMDMYSAVDGTVGDFHMVHLGARGIGGAGLLMTEMICVSAEGRITPGCAGMYTEAHVEAWKRIVEFVHGHGETRIGAQIGHSGRKGATKLLWDGADEPLEEGEWPLIAPSAVPYFEHSQVPKEMDRDDMDRVLGDFVVATGRCAEANFDLLEIHMAHGYLLSSFLSPLTNLRDDEYGGSLADRARFPLEVLSACRAAWPAERPLSVRISATDWVDGGFDGDEAVELARLLEAHGCDLVDVSTGQVSPAQKPAYGRSYQTPFADRIRNETGMPTIAVGAISSYEDVNTIILSGRADLCALARPHLYDPFWTLHAAAEQDYRGVDWIPQYLSGRKRPNDGKVVDGSLKSMRSFDDEVDSQRARWRPAASTP